MPELTLVSAEDGDCVWLTSDPDVATAKERGRTLARKLGFSVLDQASIETTIAELALNLLTYARSGEIRLEVVIEGGTMGLRVVARDWDQAHDRPELSNIQRLADDFVMQRLAGRGSVVTATKWRRSESDAA